MRWSEGLLSVFWSELFQIEMPALRGAYDRPWLAIGMGSFEMAQRTEVRSGVLMMVEKPYLDGMRVLFCVFLGFAQQIYIRCSYREQ